MQRGYVGMMVLLAAGLFALAGCTGSDIGNNRSSGTGATDTVDAADTCGDACVRPYEGPCDTPGAFLCIDDGVVVACLNGAWARLTCQDVCDQHGDKAGSLECCAPCQIDPPCPDDGLACTTEEIVAGGCQHTLQSGFCRIDDACVAAGTRHPSVACRLCAPDQLTGGWTVANDGVTCDDGDACTDADACLSGTCAGTPDRCDDEVGCTDDSCVAGTGDCLQVPDNDNCAPGSYCDPIRDCQIGVCAPGVATCIDDSRYAVCNEDGTGWANQPTDCTGATPRCLNGACVPCRPDLDDPRCVEGAPETCTAAGAWSRGPVCSGDTPICYFGRCVACDPNSGETRCVGDQPFTCDQTGTWIGDDPCAGVAPICLDGRCVACRPGVDEPRCQGNQPYVCSLQGVWVEEPACAGQLPFCLDGVCVTCDPSTDPRCVGSQVFDCDEAGAWVGGALCTGATPECVNGACATCDPGATRCDGDDVERCAADGSAWSFQETCTGPQEPRCVDGRCTACTTGDTYCDGDTVMVCNEAGTWSPQEDCTGATPTCYEDAGGVAECVSCVPGATGCDGQYVSVCTDGFTWEAVTQCVGVTPYCFDGECVECVPGTYRCAGNTLQFCPEPGAGTLPHWLDQETCGATERCDPVAQGCVDYGDNGSLRMARMETYSAAGTPTIPDAPDFRPDGPITVEAWIYPTAVIPGSNCHTGGHMIAERWQAGQLWQGQFMLAFCSQRYGAPATNDPNLGDIRFGIMWGPEITDQATCGQYPVPCRRAEWVWFDDVIFLTGANQTWHHIAAVWDRDEIRLYFNGQFMNARPIPADATFEHPAPYDTYSVQLGRFSNYSHWSFTGLIDEVRYSRGARYEHGASFIPDIYFRDDANTVGVWHFDEREGTSIFDATDGGHDGSLGTLEDGVWWNNGGVPGGTPN